MTVDADANAELGCEVTLINGVNGFVIQGAACWFHYRDGSSFLDEKAQTTLKTGETLSFTGDKPELCVELVIMVVNVCRGKQCMRGHDSNQAGPGQCLHQCTFAVKPAKGPATEMTGDIPRFVLEKVVPGG